MPALCCTKWREQVASLQLTVTALQNDLKKAHEKIAALKGKEQPGNRAISSEHDWETTNREQHRQHRRQAENEQRWPKPGQQMLLNTPAVTTRNRFEVLGELLQTDDIDRVDSYVDRTDDGEVASQNNEPVMYEKKTAVIFRDSMVRHTSKRLDRDDVSVYCYPGAKIQHIEGRLHENQDDPGIIIFHAGTNNLHGSVSPDEIMEDMKHLLQSAKQLYPQAKLGVSGIIRRRDEDIRYIDAVNSTLDWICRQEGCTFIDGNAWLDDGDLGRDGLHLNRSGSAKFSGLLGRVIKHIDGKNTEKQPVIQERKTEPNQKSEKGADESSSFQADGVHGNGKEQTNPQGTMKEPATGELFL